MIINAEIVSQPIAGSYKERIYDISSNWNSQHWTWVKFTDDELSEWYGEFRGFPIDVALSTKYNTVLILTSDYLYQLDCSSKEIIEYEEQPRYQNLTVTSCGDFIVSDYCYIELMEGTLSETRILNSPIEMDMIKFGQWDNKKLRITCEELFNGSNTIELELDGDSFEITIK